MNEASYPTPSELGIPPSRFNGFDRRDIWFREWEAVERAKQELERRSEVMLEEFGRAPLPTEYGDYTYIVYGDKTTLSHHNVLVFGQLENGVLKDKEDVLVRVHSACWTNEVAHAVNCECRKEIEETMKLIQKEEKGMLIYLSQEGRGTGVAGKMAQLNGMFGWEDGRIRQRRDKNGKRIDTDTAYKQAGYPSECRDFSPAGEILKRLDVKSVRLITNNPLKIEGVEKWGIEVTPVGIHIRPDNEIIASDLKSKAENLGHDIKRGDYEIC